MSNEVSPVVENLIRRLFHKIGPNLLETGLLERDRLGFDRHEVPLTTETLDDPMQEAYEELLDALIYLEISVEKGYVTERTLFRLINITQNLKNLINRER